jgi:ribosome modulation factor
MFSFLKKKETAAYKAGHLAYQNDKSVESNPYQESTRNAEEWEEGWRNAKRLRQKLYGDSDVLYSQIPAREEARDISETKESPLHYPEINVEALFERLQATLGEAGSFSHYFTDNEMAVERIRDAEDAVVEFEKNIRKLRLPGHFSHTLALESSLLLNLLDNAIRNKMHLTNVSEERLSFIEQSIKEVEPVVEKVIEDMEPYSLPDPEAMVKVLISRYAANKP